MPWLGAECWHICRQLHVYVKYTYMPNLKILTSSIVKNVHLHQDDCCVCVCYVSLLLF